MTVTLVAGHLKTFDLGKWVSVDEGGEWATRELKYFIAGCLDPDDNCILLGTADADGNPIENVVKSFDYIQITAMTENGLLPAHLAGIRKVDPAIHHGDLDMK